MAIHRIQTNRDVVPQGPTPPDGRASHETPDSDSPEAIDETSDTSGPAERKPIQPPQVPVAAKGASIKADGTHSTSSLLCG